MNISKTLFTNIIRCPRYAGLKEIQKNKNNAVVDIDGIISSEDKAKLREMAAQIDELEDLPSPNLDAMMEYYSQLEELSAKSVKEHFGEVIFSMETLKQKQFKANIGDYKYICFLDGYQETEDSFNVFETKATTGKKYIDLGYTENKNKNPLFYYSKYNILSLSEEKDHNLLNNVKYTKVREELFDRYSSVGRYVYDLTFQRRVIEEATKDEPEKLAKAKYYLCVLNPDYVYDGKMEKGKRVYDTSIILFIDLTQITKECLNLLDLEIKRCEKYIDESIVSPYKIGSFCERKSYHTCEFFDYCWEILPKKHSILCYLSNHHGFDDGFGNKIDRYDLINSGKTSMTDLDDSNLTREINRIQLQTVITEKTFFQLDKIEDGIKQLKYPIYHLDFESFPCPLPRFKGEKPYYQSVFQFSIHIEREPGMCDKDKDHYGFLASDHKDRREEMIKEMLRIIKPDGGSIMVYNQSFEKTRIKELSEIFPEYKHQLLALNARVFDLMDIIKGNKKLYKSLGYGDDKAALNNYYHANLDGSYSIKKVLPIFSKLTYSGMPIANGQEASAAYSKFESIDKETKDKMIKDIIEYCKQDTWAMVEILAALREFKNRETAL